VARNEEARSLWRQRITELRSGGMSLGVFACEHNLSLSSLSRWNRRFDDHLNLLPKPRRAKSLDPKEVPIPGKDRTEVPQWVAVVAADKDPTSGRSPDGPRPKTTASACRWAGSRSVFAKGLTQHSSPTFSGL